MTNNVKQADREGLYTSDIIGGRYQVLESDVFRGSYFVFDLTTEDMLRSKDGSTNYFDAVESATAVAEGAAPAAMVAKAVKVKQPKPVREQKSKPVKEKKAESVTSSDTAAPKPKKGSANAMILELIKTTELSDEEISAEVLKVYPDCKTTKPYDVKYRRRKVAAGEL